MEDGQKVVIPLDSGLDVHSSDMLVPVNQPKFQHNRQKYQGRYLPTSLRYEHNGWAAGNDVYTFDVSYYTIKAGKYNIFKQKINENPSYQISAIEGDDYSDIKASAIFNNKSRILSFDTDTAAVSAGVNPSVTGFANSKYFSVKFDSAKNTFTLDSASSKDIRLVSAEVQSDYTAEIKLEDRSAVLNIAFEGAVLPTDIYNGQYLLGKFQLYTDMSEDFEKDSAYYVSKWSYNQFSCYYDGSKFWLSVDDTTVKEISAVDSDGNIVLSFDIDLQFTDNPSVQLVNFFPFFTSVVAVPASDVIYNSVTADLSFNKWSAIVSDPVNTASNISDKLYRNIPKYSDADDYNTQRITQKVPLWFGVSAQPLTIDIAGKDITHASGDNMLTVHVTGIAGPATEHDVWIEDDEDIYGGHYATFTDYNNDQEAYIYAKCTDTVQGYSDKVRIATVTVWEQTINKSAEYCEHQDRTYNVRVKYSYHKWYEDIDENIDDESSTSTWRTETIREEAYFTIDDTFSFTSLAELKEMFSVSDSSLVHIDSISVDNGYSYRIFVDVFKSPFSKQYEYWQAAVAKGGSALTDYLNSVTSNGRGNDYNQIWIDLSDNAEIHVNEGHIQSNLKDCMTSLGSKASYSKRLRANDGDSESEVYGHAYWARCCTAQLSSDIYIVSDNLLTSSLDSSYFACSEVPVKKYTADDYDMLKKGKKYTSSIPFQLEHLYLNDYFVHKVASAAYSQQLNLSIYLCAKLSNMYMFYAQNAPDSSTSYVPEHIVLGSVRYAVSDSNGNLTGYNIQKNYSDLSVNTGYSLYTTITAQAAMLEDKQYSYISLLQSSFDNSLLVPGNSFTDNYADSLQPLLILNVSNDFKFKVVLNAASIYDYDQLQITGQTVQLSLQGTEIFSSKYMLDGNLPDVKSAKFSYSGYDVSVRVAQAQDNSENQNTPSIQLMQLVYSTSAVYHLDFIIPKSLDSNWHLEQLQNNIADVLSSDSLILIHTDYTQKTAQIKIRNNADSNWHIASVNSIYFSSNNSIYAAAASIYTILAVLYGVFNPADCTVISVSNNNIILLVNGEQVGIDISENGLFDSTKKSTMQYNCTKVDSASLDCKTIAECDIEQELQFVKQQWDTTTATENFWWVDSSHVLVLDKYSFILRKKTLDISDWDGDIFEDTASWPRYDYLPGTVIKYFMTDAYNGESAKLVTVSAESDNIILKVYNPLNDMHTDYTVTLPIEKRRLGTALCPDSKKLYTYSDLLVQNVASRAKWSGTCIDNRVIIGIHFDCNINQWAVIISDVDVQVLHGYGFVGLDGSLTGGELPAKYFDTARGFIGTIQPLSVLSDSNHDISSIDELYKLDDLIVGTDSQQWYISKNIPSVISHLQYANGIYTAKKLPLNNNYAVKYASASFCSTVFADYYFKVKSLKDLFPESNGVWTALLALAGWPMIYFFNPKIAVANYLQQTLGQAAYVHYNSTDNIQSVDITAQDDNIHSEVDTVKYNSAVSSDEISFDRQSVRQSQSNSNPYASSIFLLFASAGVSALDWAQDTVQINKGQNQSAVSDSGNKYSQYFLQNMLSMTGANMQVNAITPSQTSEVTAIKTLDMFYSTSDRQNICAGRGYVNHNFVAQCIAQSVTNVQSVFTQQTILYTISALTVYQLQLTNKILTVTKEAIEQQIQANGGGAWFIGGFSNGGNASGAVAIALGFSWAAAALACNASQIGLELLPTVVDSLGGGKLQSTITANQSANNRDIEAKHAYGSKHEHFMWPCFGITSAQSITDESVTVEAINKPWKLDLSLNSPRKQIDNSQPSFITGNVPDSVSERFKGQVPYYIAMLKGKQASAALPSDMAYVIGTESFLPSIDFKNQNIAESAVSFDTPLIQDYILDKSWQLSQTATNGMTLWISCKDTKIIDGEYSNCVVSSSFCGIASPYAAIEVKRGIFSKYLRPTLLTPQALGLNITGLNSCYEEKAYHAFDGYGYRIVNWMGSAGMNKERQTLAYMFLVNDRFKRSNKLPVYELVGNFKSDPATAISGDYNDTVFIQVDHPGQDHIMGAGAIGEDKNVIRIALPVFSEVVNTLPAAVKTISTQQLSVIDGITSLTTNNRDLQSAYKAPVSIDFTIGRNNYRFTSEYICSLTQQTGVTLVEQLVPCLGLEFIGATPYEAYFYSQDTQQYYMFTGGSSLKMVDMIERFRNVLHGRYDFVSQEVLLPCIATFLRLDNKVSDSDTETDNIIVPRLKDGEFIGEAAPPVETIFNDRSGFKTLSLPCGVLYQGPNRCIIVRYNFQNYMTEQIKANYGKWKRVPREEYHPFRVYKDIYRTVEKFPAAEVKGWTHNPFLLVTAPLGVNADTDCMFEWEITFCWPVEMDKLYPDNTYAVVNIQSETMTPGGKVIAARPAHVFLKKDLFTFSGNYGYYSFRYSGKCGAGNRERLHIWSDQYICVSGLQCEYKQVTTQRTSKLVQQADVYGMQEI